MCKEIYVLLSTRKKDNETLDMLLEPLIKMKVKVTKGRSGQKVFPRDDLPFLKTDEGTNAYGIDEIKDFVEWERRRMKHEKETSRKGGKKKGISVIV